MDKVLTSFYPFSVAKVGDLTTFILGALKGEESGRVALYHYLKNFFKSDSPINPELINTFFFESLHLPHWQEHKSKLQEDILELLQRFYSQSGEPFRLDLILDLSRIQIVNISHIDNLCNIVKDFEHHTSQDGESFRVFPESESRALCIRRNALGEVTVKTYSSDVRIQGATLSPLLPDQELYYDAGLELKKGTTQKLRPALHSQARFVVETTPEIHITAQFVGGLAFRQNQHVVIKKMIDEPRIFFPLKKLERYFIFRPSDPYYMETISVLERALNMLQTKNEGALEYARRAFDSGQIAFDQIFPDDKALYSRLRELAKWISNPAVRQAYGSQPEAEA